MTARREFMAEPAHPVPGTPVPRPPKRVKPELAAILAEQHAAAEETAGQSCGCRVRVAPEPNMISWAELLKRSESEFHCRRLRRWLRASVVLNALLAAAVCGCVAGLVR